MVRWGRCMGFARYDSVVRVTFNQQLVATLNFRQFDREGVLHSRSSMGMTVMGGVSIGQSRGHGDDHCDRDKHSKDFHFGISDEACCLKRNKALIAN